MNMIFGIAFLLGLLPFLAEKCKWICGKSYRIGIFFGICSLLTNAGNVYIPSVNVMMGIQDIPVILASFYFGTAAGLIAGAFSFLMHLILAFFGCFQIPYDAALAVLVVALYSVAMMQWVFDEQRPPIIPATVIAFFGSVVHLCVMFFVGFFFGKESDMLDILSECYPYIPLCAALSAGIAAAVCGTWRRIKRDFYISFCISLLLLGVAFHLIESFSIDSGYQKTENAIRVWGNKLQEQIEGQIDYNLHGIAEVLIKNLQKPEKYDRSTLQRYADMMDVDEINIFTKDGKLLASNRQNVIDNNRTEQDLSLLKDFFALTDGTRNFVSQDFRASRSEPDVIAKYAGIAFPDRDAFLQIGFNFKHLLAEFDTYFFPMFDKAKIEDTGFFLVTDSDGKIVAPVAGHPGLMGKHIFDIGFQQAEWNKPAEKFFEAKLFNTYGACYRSFDIGEWRIYEFLPYTEFMSDAVSQICLYTVILFLVCIAFRRTMVRIAKDQKKFDDMLATDMELASTIQNSELPNREYSDGSCRINASMTPAKEVGGDFYDYYGLPDGRVVVTIADVSGKGIPAAIFMMKAKSILKELVGSGMDLAHGVAETNARLNKNNNGAMFVTAWIGIFEPATDTLHYTSAGHNPPLILRRDGTVEWLNKDKRQKPLAAFAKVAYQESSIAFAPGDRLFLYTDGVTEAMNVRGELFGNERLENALQNAKGPLIDSVTESLKQFTAAAPVADDITILTLENKHELDC